MTAIQDLHDLDSLNAARADLRAAIKSVRKDLSRQRTSRPGIDFRSNRDIGKIVRFGLARWGLPITLFSRQLLDQQRRPHWWMDAVNPTPPPQSWPMFVGRKPMVIPCACRWCKARKAA